MWLIHVDYDHGDVMDRIDIHTIKLPAGKATEIKNDFIAKKLMEHKHFHGIVEVPYISNDEGIKLDVTGAKLESAAILQRKEKERINNYIRTQLEDRIKQNSPALPPDDITARLLRKHNVELADYGVKPIGWNMKDVPREPAEPLDLASARDKAQVELETQNRVLNEKSLRQDKLIAKLMEQMGLTEADLEI